MKMLDYLLAPVALVGLVATGWWGLYQSPQRPANLAAQLEQDANAALARNGYDWAHVRMNGQRAVLTGAAPSEDAAMAAAETILHSAWTGGVVMGGVTVVEVAVDPGLPVSPFSWRAQKLADGRIILSGHVPSRMIASQIEAEATRLSGGQAPENRMEVAAGAPGGNWQGVARFGLALLSELDNGDVRLSTTRCVLAVWKPTRRSGHACRRRSPRWQRLIAARR
jgi:OOP family OmpA-OmpF porin